MRTQKQIEASRWNGQKSRGPVSSEGKRVSSQNSFKTGLYSQALVTHGEKREDFETLRGEYYARHSPQTPEERETLDTVILLAWQLRRYGVVETHSWNLEIRRAELHAPAHMLEGNLYGSAFFGADQRFARIHRMQAATQRNFKNALQDLELLKAARPAQPIEEETTSLDLGFVPSIPVEEPPMPANTDADASSAGEPEAENPIAAAPSCFDPATTSADYPLDPRSEPKSGFVSSTWVGPPLLPANAAHRSPQTGLRTDNRISEPQSPVPVADHNTQPQDA
jgi:hypothetical protein